MDKGWIKLYRKSKENPLMRDFTAWGIFCWIMLSVDKETGQMSFGRFWAAEYFSISPSTFRDAIYRLRDKYKVIDTSSDNRKTTVILLNWAKYQSSSSLTPPPPTTGRQLDDNKATLNKNKRIKNKEYIYNIYFKKFLENFNFLYKSEYKQTKKLNELYNLRRKVYSVEELNEAVVVMHDQPFYRGKNDTGWKPTPEFILRNDEKVDEFLNLRTKTHPIQEYDIDPNGIARIKQMKEEAGL